MASNRMLISSKESWHELDNCRNEESEGNQNDCKWNVNKFKSEALFEFILLKLDLSIEEKLKDN